ncbi:ATPase [Solibacillus silvestris]|uniref:ATPase n=1 Tax=Solibacillus silvestris TaxID=76853 RepID=UPI003F800C97
MPVDFNIYFFFQFGFSTAIISALLIGSYFYYKKKPKVDKGFKFAYYGLSYRRKFLRTMYSIPIYILSLAIIYFAAGFSDFFIFSTTLLAVLLVIQASYNYIKWQKEL